MYKRLFISILFVILMIVCLITCIGCTMFQLPTGVWNCKKLEMSIDFTCEIGHWAYGGILYSNECNHNLICKLDHITGEMNIYDGEKVILENHGKSPISAEPLYHGSLQNRGTKKRKFYMKNPRKEYVFVKVE